MFGGRFFLNEVEMVKIWRKPYQMANVENCAFGHVLFISFLYSQNLLFGQIEVQSGIFLLELVHHFADMLFTHLLDDGLSENILVKIVGNFDQFLIQFILRPVAGGAAV